MGDICPTCGIPRDICVCKTITFEQQQIVVRLEMRKWGKPTTIIEGLDAKRVDIADLGSKLKSTCACGGTQKNGAVILQGDHRGRIKAFLVEAGFPAASIEIH